MTDNFLTSRRRLLQMAAAGTSALALPSVTFAKTEERRLAFRNLHTGEKVDTVYWAEGEYLFNELEDINRVLRDHRTDEIMSMDVQLLDNLTNLQQTLGIDQTFDVISGYRSPQSNAALRSKSHGVAKKSYHMLGQAVDIRIANITLAEIHSAAVSLKAGGVGKYSRSGFLHIDTGAVRSWGK